MFNPVSVSRIQTIHFKRDIYWLQHVRHGAFRVREIENHVICSVVEVPWWLANILIYHWKILSSKKQDNVSWKIRVNSVFVYLFVCLTVQRSSFFSTYYTMNSSRMISSSSGSFPLVLTEYASVGGAGWCFHRTHVPFSFTSFFC